MEAAQQTHALLLNADYTPLKVVTWKRAMELLFDNRKGHGADLVEGYADRFIRSVSNSFPWPAVLRLRTFVSARVRIRFNRQNVLARDRYTCAYCGDAPKNHNGKARLEELTLDHVIPRAQSKNGTVRTALGKTLSITCWENVVTSCQTCNLRKADRTPAQAGMVLKFAPRAPTKTDVLRMHLKRIEIPDEWVQYLPEGAQAWGGYWTEELDAE